MTPSNTKASSQNLDSLSVSDEKTEEDPSTVSANVPGRHRFSRFHGFGMKNPPPPKASIEDATMIPEATAGWFSLLTFEWITPLLSLGYARPLEASDLYRLQDDRSAAYIADKILTSFEARRIRANEYNERLANGQVKAGWRNIIWTLKGNRADREKHWREVAGKRKASLALAMNDSVKWFFWSGGVLKVLGDTAQVTSPLVVKAIINFATESYTDHRTPGSTNKIPSVGTGIGLTFGLLALQIISSLCTHHFFYRSAGTGVLLRGGLITAIYNRSLVLTSRARSTLTNGKLVNHISTDVSRIDFCCGFFHMVWAAPIQMTICLIILLINLGPSALAGFGFFILATPAQTYAMKRLFRIRQKSMQWTDKRAKLLQELLGGMKIIKFFGWEIPFLERIFGFRRQEMAYVRSLLLIRAGNSAFAMSLPVLASVLSFVTYSLSGHTLEPAVIFTSLTLFQLLRMPLMFLPMSLSAIADATNATQRLYAVFESETLGDTQIHDSELKAALDIKGAKFEWDTPPPQVEEKKKKRRSNKTPEVVDANPKTDTPFKVRETNLSIPRGQLVAIVGPVGTGKTSLLQGLIGEMRRTEGSVTFGGSVSYCSQNAWIQNATIRDNICFGRPFEPTRYWKIVKDACLEPDLDMLAPTGDLTEVGEKGISLSGGQKQRLSIARAIYCNADIEIFDDPLSALDAHVGKSVFENVLRNNPAGKTRILVTHALHFLPQVDYILTIVDGNIAERGTFTDLMSNKGEFAKFIAEFGSKEEESSPEEIIVEDEIEATDSAITKARQNATASTTGQMQVEERNTGAISGAVYKTYLKAGNGAVVLPLLLLSVVLIQASNVMSSYWLVYWQEEKWHQSQGFYMGIYAGLGVSQALFNFFMGAMFALLTYYASQRLHKAAIERVLHAPMSFFETTPLGRIMNRFSKDIDTVDNLLGDALRMFASTLSAILGAIILISIVLPWFLIGVVCVSVIYVYAAIFYRASARELKRLDAILRSSLYSHFSESLSGLATIRAYGESERFRKDNEHRVDIENRAYWLTVTNQRWLGIRVDALGATLTFVVAILTVATRFSISPAQTGLVLSYILSVQQSFGWLIRQTAEVENDMNSVERVVHYATEVEQEAPHNLPGDKITPTSWPSQGQVEFTDVVFKYRPELPPVLKGLNMSVKPGEKIGIVGRTGAGKSSIMTALFRIVELTSGSISIDGIDISKVGLADLRQGLSIIPQDPLLFSGTLRTNLDPFGLHDDARLWDALRRSYLVESATAKGQSIDLSTEDNHASGAHTPVNRFSLDSPVEDEGNNLSIGQRSLVSLARALVKDTKILILDEATASVDYETDRKIQDTISTEFVDRTILCIAHRLRTIISYDRICVLDAGQIAEFDTPTNLFHQNGIFKTMCDRSGIALEDIRLASKIREAQATDL